MEIKHITKEQHLQEKIEKMTLAKTQEISGIDSDYGKKVDELIRERYSLADELALSRQREEKPTEWAEFYAYCEECKQRAKTDN